MNQPQTKRLPINLQVYSTNIQVCTGCRHALASNKTHCEVDGRTLHDHAVDGDCPKKFYDAAVRQLRTHKPTIADRKKVAAKPRKNAPAPRPGGCIDSPAMQGRRQALATAHAFVCAGCPERVAASDPQATFPRPGVVRCSRVDKARVPCQEKSLTGTCSEWQAVDLAFRRRNPNTPPTPLIPSPLPRPSAG